LSSVLKHGVYVTARMLSAGIYLYIPSPLAPDCCSRLTANVTTKTNKEMFNGEVKKEWEKTTLLTDFCNYFTYVSVDMSPHLSHPAYP